MTGSEGRCALVLGVWQAAQNEVGFANVVQVQEEIHIADRHQYANQSLLYWLHMQAKPSDNPLHISVFMETHTTDSVQSPCCINGLKGRPELLIGP